MEFLLKHKKSSENISDLSKVVMVLGTFSHEGLDAKVRGLDMTLLRKGLRSSERNWLKIAELISSYRENDRLATVLVDAPTPTLLHISGSIYDGVREKLFDELELSNAHIFLHEDNFSSKIEPAPWDIADLSEEELLAHDIPWSDLIELDQDALQPFSEITQDVISMRSHSRRPTREEWLRENADAIQRAESCLHELQRRNISLVPFKTRSDVTIRVFEILEDAQAGIFLRLYVPHGRYQSEQFEDFLTMFSRYLREAEGREFSITTDRTLRGTSYVFKGRGEVTDLSGMNGAISRFDDFLTLAQTNPQAAESLLTGNGKPSPQAAFIVAKYARHNRRLAMEIRHEHDRRRLQLQQEMEAELLDARDIELLPMPSPNMPSGILSVMGNIGPVTVNINGSVLGNAVEHAILGDVTYTLEERALLEIIKSLPDRIEVLQLQSDVERLKDRATSPEERSTAVQRLKGFIYKIGKTAVEKSAEFGMDALLKYLERQLGAP
jgi:hypothetical protein